MSSSCGNCDCADKSQCGFVETVVMDAPAVEHDCKCGSNCTCTNCTCGH
ncbi:metallothionein-like protein type 3-like [Trifolium medium]|uniref:Metallothionein-like protein type 3-like n=1 Tax=Trifolium medium TaxID=97028 RepID=A0A392MRV8_9FABA|nr:metallothionein-like protein type 3-like [Trifolium medium]